MNAEQEHPMQKVFLLTSAPAHQNGIGSIFLRDILAAAPELDVYWRVVEPYMLGSIRSRRGLFWRALTAAFSRMGILNDARLHLFQFRQLRRMADQIEQEYRASGASKIWVTTSSPELILLAQVLAQRAIYICVTVWDAPEYLMQNLRMSKRTQARVIERFWLLLRQARSCSVVSDNMKTEYSMRTPDLPIVYLRHGIAQMPAVPKSHMPSRVLRMVFAGSLYSKKEWNALVQALVDANWMVAGRKIQLEFVGHFPMREAKRPKELVIHPAMPLDEVLAFMARADIGYLPYWLDPARAFAARTSFPGKMTAYSASGLAIFHHGPEFSSVSDFLARYPYGVVCNSFATEAILNRLDALIQNIGTEPMRSARDAAMAQELSDAAMLRGVRQLLGAPATRHWKTK